MNLSLTPELDQFIADPLGTGRYRSASEVVLEGMRLRQHREEEHAAKLEVLRKAVAEGVAQLDRSGGVGGAEAFAEILRGLDQSGQPDSLRSLAGCGRGSTSPFDEFGPVAQGRRNSGDTSNYVVEVAGSRIARAR